MWISALFRPADTSPEDESKKYFVTVFFFLLVYVQTFYFHSPQFSTNICTVYSLDFQEIIPLVLFDIIERRLPNIKTEKHSKDNSWFVSANHTQHKRLEREKRGKDQQHDDNVHNINNKQSIKTFLIPGLI